MKMRLVTFCAFATIALFATPAVSEHSEQCAMCHDSKSESLNPGHQDCTACHTGYEGHLENPMDNLPGEATVETCQTCHEPTDDFKADPHHDMGMECFACHSIHDDG